MAVGILHIHLSLPACTSLKQKRGLLKSILARLHRQFNISAAEVDLLDRWDESIIACALISNDRIHAQQVLQKIVLFLQFNFPDVDIFQDNLEII